MVLKEPLYYLRLAKDCFVANMCGNFATNCLISCTLLSPCLSSNWDEITLAFLLRTGPTPLKFLSLQE